MTRTEDDLRAMYAELADQAPHPQQLRVLPDLLAHTDGPSAGSGHRARRLATAGLVAAAALAGAFLLPAELHGLGTTSASAEPITVLRQAAAEARKQPDVTPRADQFYYLQLGGSEWWLSVDGTQNGLRQAPGAAPEIVPGCRGGLAQEPGNYPGTRQQPCTPDPAFLPDVPTTETGMLAYLQSHYGAAGANGIGKAAFELLQFHYLYPAARAAFFQALTQQPGLRTVNLPAVDGQPVIGVTWSSTGPQNAPAAGKESATLVFSRSSHSFITLETTGTNGEPGAGGTTSREAIVDHAGQRP